MVTRHPSRLLRGGLVACLSVGLLASVPRLAAAQSARPDPEVSVGVRPERVRVGDEVTVTVRIVGSAWPAAVELEPGPAAELRDAVDRSSTQAGSGGVTSNVFERDFILAARAPGVLSIPAVLIDYEGQILEAVVPAVTVAAAGLDWGTPGGSPRGTRPTEERLLPEGVPPRVEGRGYDATSPYPRGWPGTPVDPTWSTFGVPPGTPGATTGVPYGRGLGQYPSETPGGGYGPGGYSPGGHGPGGYSPGGYSPGGYSPGGYSPGGYSPGGYSPGGYGVYGGFGRLPPGEGWAATATADPWWPEIVPELGYYPSAIEDPEGLALLQTGLTPERVYVGQQATLVATATFPPEARYRMTRDPEFFPAGATDAWVVDVPWAAPAPAAVGGRLEEAHTFLRAYFPMTPGRLTVQPARLSYSAGGGGTGRPALDTLVSDALTAEVMPIPEVDAPPTWNGAVGRYRISAWLTPERVGWGESALLMVEIAGVGHLPSQPRPDPGPVWGGGLRPMGERAWIEIRDGVVGGVKRFTWLVVPVEPGEIRLGPIFYSFFDPYIGAFGQVLSEELVLYAETVTAGSGAPGARPADLNGPVDPYAGVPDTWPEADVLPEEGEVSPSNASQPAGAGAPSSGVSMTLSPRGTGADGASPAGSASPEADAQQWVDRVEADPEQADAWFALGESLERSRPGEGWDAWAFRSGLIVAPRDPTLQRGVWGEATWRSDVGVPLLPLRRGEAFLATTLLGLFAAAFGLAGLAVGWNAGWRGEARGFAIAALVLATGAGVTGASWRSGDVSATGVVVGSPTELRVDPAAASQASGTLPTGVPVRRLEQYGDWTLVEDPSGRRGWIEIERIAPLMEASRARS